MASRSLSLRRAWIEIFFRFQLWSAGRSLSLRRAWIEISWQAVSAARHGSRSPYGERGLKFERLDGIIGVAGSLSLRRAWIEIG